MPSGQCMSHKRTICLSVAPHRLSNILCWQEAAALRPEAARAGALAGHCALVYGSTHSVRYVVQMASQLAAAEKEAARLRPEAARAGALAGQSQGLMRELEEAKEGRRLVTVESQKQRGLLEKELQTAGKARDQLAEQVSQPSFAAVTCVEDLSTLTKL